MNARLFVIILFLITTGFVTNISAQLIKGINVVGAFDEKLNDITIASLQDINTNWIAFTPEAKINRQTLEIRPDNSHNLWIHSDTGYVNFIKDAKSAKLKVMLKPHLVLDKITSQNDRIKLKSAWRGDIKLWSKTDWSNVEREYTAYILAYAKVAQENDVDLFIIGTELKSFVKKRPKYWASLISQVKSIYNGPISYSANWDNYENIPFWDDLSLICVNGYFPISNEVIPSIERTEMKWSEIKFDLEAIAKKHRKKVLISEFGYRNIERSGKEPWLHVNQTKNDVRSDIAQQNLFQAFFNQLWRSDFIIGGFIWNWQQTPPKPNNSDFTIQNKPVQELIKQTYSRTEK